MTRRHYWTAGSTAFAAAFLLCGYEFIRSASNTLYKAAYGKERLPIIMALMPLGVLAILHIYGRTLTRLGPRRTLFWSSIASAVVIGATTLAIQAGSHLATGVLYIVREAYVVLLIEQYWSFINSSLGRNEAKKLNGAIMGVASLGAILGGTLIYYLAEPLGTNMMPLFAAAALIPAAFVSDWGYARVGEPEQKADEKSEHGSFTNEFRSTPVLVIILLLIVTTQIVSTALDLRFQGILQDEIPDPDKQTSFSGGFFAGLNTGAAFLQFVLTPIILRFVPLTIVHLAIPAIHLVACSALLVSPSLATAGTAYLLFKCFDYSIFRAAKEILYIPLSYNARYRAKEIIDVFGYRFSKGGCSLLIVFAQKAGIILGSGYTVIALSASAFWLLLCIPLRKFYPAEVSAETPPPPEPSS